MADSQIEKTLSEALAPAEQTVCLIAAANANGGRDNISVIVVKVGAPASPDQWWKKFLKKPADT